MADPIPAPTTAQKDSAKPIILVSYPKIVILYPTFLASLIAAILSMFLKEDHEQQIIGVVFLAIMGVNMVVLAFDFPRTTSLNLFFVGVVIIMGTYLVSITQPNLLPELTKFLKRFNPSANATFYFGIFGILTMLYTAMIINIRFDYWEVGPNELLHHHGFLASTERYSAPNLRISKEIDDVFEYMLLRSGRLVIHASNEPRAFVLDTVLNIDRKEMAITQMLGALQVQVREEVK